MREGGGEEKEPENVQGVDAGLPRVWATFADWGGEFHSEAGLVHSDFGGFDERSEKMGIVELEKC